MELAELIEKSRVDNVYLRKGPRPQQPGSLALIGHHLIFSAAPKPGEKHSHDDELWVIIFIFYIKTFILSTIFIWEILCLYYPLYK